VSADALCVALSPDALSVAYSDDDNALDRFIKKVPVALSVMLDAFRLSCMVAANILK